MSKLDSQSASLTSSPVSRSDSGSARRLIVLVPQFNTDVAPATRRVWELANAMSARVQFIGLYSDPTQEPGLRRQLVTMSAIVKDDRVSVEMEVIFGKDWVGSVKSRWQAGDMVVCFAEQRVGLLRKPLSQILQENLNVPFYILAGLYPQIDSRLNWPAQILAWTGSIAIIFGFFLLQIKIDDLAKDWTQIVLLLLSITVEVWMIWVWNSLSG